MEGLLGIRGEKSTNKILRDAVKQKKGLVQEITNDDSTNQKNEDEEQSIGGDGGNSMRKSQSPFTNQILCAICRKQKSTYTCPKCNLPYCSLNCFRSNKHQRCSESFAKQTIEDEKQLMKANKMMGENGEEDNDIDVTGFVDKTERRKMMDVLRKLQRLDAKLDDVNVGKSKASLNLEDGVSEIEEGDEEGEEEDEEWEDVKEQAEKVGIDLENANEEELMALLNAEERKEFRELIQRAEVNGNSSEIQNLLKPSLSNKVDNEIMSSEIKWWEMKDSVQFKDKSRPQISEQFTKELDEIVESMKRNTKLSSLEWNIVAVSLAYVYIVRHLDVANLQLKTASMETQTAIHLFQKLVPFLANPNPKSNSANPWSQTILASAEDGTIWLLSRLGIESGKMPAEMIQYLYNQIQQTILQKSKILIQEQDECQYMIYLLYDLYCLTNKADRRKVIFYAAYWKYFVSNSTTQYPSMIVEIEKEVNRLKAEVERTEDEERWKAAHDAIEQNGGILLPK